jgi:hypothetical protein
MLARLSDRGIFERGKALGSEEDKASGIEFRYEQRNEFGPRI